MNLMAQVKMNLQKIKKRVFEWIHGYDTLSDSQIASIVIFVFLDLQQLNSKKTAASDNVQCFVSSDCTLAFVTPLFHIYHM